MNDRTLLLIEIIQNPCPGRPVIEELAEYGIDSDEPLATVTRTHIISMMHQFGNGTLGADNLKAWAIRLLGRRDIEFEFGPEGVVEEALFWIAYEEISDWENRRLCRHIESMLERRKQPRD